MNLLSDFEIILLQKPKRLEIMAAYDSESGSQVAGCHRSQGRLSHHESQGGGCPQEWTQGRKTTKEKSMRIAIYSRVSTLKQDTENQLRQLREFAAKQGWEVVHEYVDLRIWREG
jgi:Resolvase, N terminal domain